MVTPDDKPTFRDRLRALGLAIGLVALGWLAVEAPNPPAALSAGSPPGEFSAERALTHLQVIADRVHPINSPANAAVCRYLADQLKVLGCEVETQPFTYNPQGWQGSNVLARIPGSHATNEKATAVMLACHHDSVRAGPGASDDGVAVAALLETARALRAGPVLRNDIILLFTDGEELPDGLPGAQAFVTSSPWCRDVGCVFNFDARGVSGPELMYETSAGNGPLIREFSRTARRPVANSLMSEVYRHMPNDTDFTVFRQAGMPGLNFAFIGGVEHYHQPSDDLAHVSLSTLQHAGDLALGLARHFGNVDLTGLRGADAVYFDLLGRVLVRYPGTWAMPLALAGAVLFIVVTGQAWKRGEISGWKLAGAVLMWGLILLLVVALFGFGHEWILRRGHGEPAWLARLRVWPYWFLALGLTITLSTALPAALGRWLESTSLALGALWWWLLLALASAWWMPGGSFVGIWPLLFGLASVWLAWRPLPPTGRQTVRLIVMAVPALVLAPPLMYEAYVALGPNAAALPMLVFALVVGALWLQAAAVARAWKWTLPVAGLAVAAVAVLISWIRTA
jgi:hypothetical protein